MIYWTLQIVIDLHEGRLDRGTHSSSSESQFSLMSFIISEHMVGLFHLVQVRSGFVPVALYTLLQVALYKVLRSPGSWKELQTSSIRLSWLSAEKNSICSSSVYVCSLPIRTFQHWKGLFKMSELSPYGPKFSLNGSSYRGLVRKTKEKCEV